jgi:hypothetical protein
MSIQCDAFIFQGNIGMHRKYTQCSSRAKRYFISSNLYVSRESRARKIPSNVAMCHEHSHGAWLQTRPDQFAIILMDSHNGYRRASLREYTVWKVMGS